MTWEPTLAQIKEPFLVTLELFMECCAIWVFRQLILDSHVLSQMQVHHILIPQFCRIFQSMIHNLGWVCLWNNRKQLSEVPADQYDLASKLLSLILRRSKSPESSIQGLIAKLVQHGSFINNSKGHIPKK